MLFETNGQIIALLATIVFSVTISIICELIRLLYSKSKSKWIIYVGDFSLSATICTLFWLLCLHFSFGEIRLYLILLYILGLILGSFVFTKIKLIIIKKRLIKLLNKKKKMWSSSFPFPAPIFSNKIISCLNILLSHQQVQQLMH